MACGLRARGAVSAPATLATDATPVREALDGAMTAIAAAGCATPRLDAELLLAHALGVDRVRLLIDDLAVPDSFEALLARRQAREPVAYIVGWKDFRRVRLAVDRRVLIPRPESELLVEAALSLQAGSRVLDVGTGCGALALALADERPELQLAGSDISEAALSLARENAARLGLRVRWLRSDLLVDVADEFDAVLANLPYVAEGERALLAPEILRHEPAGALFAGADGLAVIRALLAQLQLRRRVRMVALEVGAGQAPAVAELVAGAGFAAVRCERDLAGIERVVIAEGRRA